MSHRYHRKHGNIFKGLAESAEDDGEHQSAADLFYRNELE